VIEQFAEQKKGLFLQPGARIAGAQLTIGEVQLKVGESINPVLHLSLRCSKKGKSFAILRNAQSGSVGDV
jgi:hypothetical protein